MAGCASVPADRLKELRAKIKSRESFGCKRKILEYYTKIQIETNLLLFFLCLLRFSDRGSPLFERIYSKIFKLSRSYP